MKLIKEQSANLVTLGDIVDFSIIGVTLMGQVLSLFEADTTIAKVRCIVDKAEKFFYVEVGNLKPARFPEYYSAA